MTIPMHMPQYRQVPAADTFPFKCRVGNPSKIGEQPMYARPGMRGLQQQTPDPCAISGAVRQLQRPRSSSVPRGVR